MSVCGQMARTLSAKSSLVVTKMQRVFSGHLICVEGRERERNEDGSF